MLPAEWPSLKASAPLKAVLGVEVKAALACYCLDDGRPGIDPEVAVRLMLAGLITGIRKLMREAQVNIAIREDTRDVAPCTGQNRGFRAVSP
jgi:hypothetical protein